MTKLSVVLAARNEEENIASCLESIKDIADEIIVVDENSTDKTVDIAKKYGADVFEEPHHPVFHETKQIALSKAKGEWVLQLDADEIVTKDLAAEIKNVINLSTDEIDNRARLYPLKWKLFQRHMEALEKRDGPIGYDSNEITAFFIPRLNYFLGAPMKHSGIYPDGVIRLVKNGKARFPAKTVHEQIEVDGRVSWLFNDLIHNDSPTFSKYIWRLNRYTDLHASELSQQNTPKNIIYLIYYSIFRAKFTFLRIFFFNAGFKDGDRGFIWSVFSALHYPVAYFKYWTNK